MNIRVMLDTNILVSAIVFESKLMFRILEKLENKYSLVLCSYAIDELREVFKEKFPQKTIALERFLTKSKYELFYTPQILPKHDLFIIRDKKDEKILYSAILSDVDVLVTGDNDLLAVENVARPEILSHLEFLEKYW